MSDLPPPPVDAETDLRDFRFMPLDVVRFAHSDLVTTEAPEIIVAAFLLWGASWHQVPASSLPDDDRVLSQLAGYGRAVAAWRDVKAGALRGFVKCSDGRLYHSVVAEKARDAWLGKLKQRWRTYCSAIRQHNSRNADDHRESPAFDDWLESGRQTTVKRDKSYPQQPDLPLPDEESNAQQPKESRATAANVTRRDSTKGEGEGEGEGDSTTTTRAGENDVDVEKPEDLMSLTERLTRIAGVSTIRPTVIAREMDIVKRWRAAGFDVEGLIIPTIEKRVDDMREDETISSLALFDAAILKKSNGGRSRRSSPASPAASVATTDDDDPRIESLRVELRAVVGPRAYDGWLKPGSTSIHVNGTTTTIKAASLFAANWISDNLSSKIVASVKAAGCPADVRIEAL